jgi:hypothetical protein
MLWTEQASAERRRKRTSSSPRADGTAHSAHREDTTMQAREITTVKRFSVTRMGIAVAAAGTLALGLVGANALQDATRDGNDARPVAVTRGSAPVDQAARIRFTEWNTQLPAAVAPVRTYGEIRFLEQNTTLPTGTTTVARSYSDIRFLEQNLLPEASVVAPVQTAAEMRFLEVNTQLPTGSVAVAPSFEQIRFLEMNLLPEGVLVAPNMVSGVPS